MHPTAGSPNEFIREFANFWVVGSETADESCEGATTYWSDYDSTLGASLGVMISAVLASGDPKNVVVISLTSYNSSDCRVGANLSVCFIKSYAP